MMGVRIYTEKRKKITITVGRTKKSVVDNIQYL